MIICFRCGNMAETCRNGIHGKLDNHVSTSQKHEGYICNSACKESIKVSDSPGLVDFAIGLVKSVFNLPDGQVMFFEEFE